MSFRSWMINYSTIFPMLSDAGCPINSPWFSPYEWDFDLRKPVQFNGTNYGYHCFLDQSPMKVIGFAAQELSPWLLYSKYSGNVLGPEAESIRNIMFQNKFYDNSFLEVMGYAFRNMLTFHPKVHAYIEPTLKKFIPNYKFGEGNICSYSSDQVVIGIHARHFDISPNNTFDLPMDSAFVKSLGDLLDRVGRDKKCILLLASDREHSLAFIQSAAQTQGCQVHLAPKGMNTSHPMSENPDCDELCVEQGPWAKGITQLADLLLLGHSQFLLMTYNGGQISTFSLAMSYLVAWTHSEIDFYRSMKGIVGDLNPFQLIFNDGPAQDWTVMEFEKSRFNCIINETIT